MHVQEIVTAALVPDPNVQNSTQTLLQARVDCTAIQVSTLKKMLVKVLQHMLTIAQAIANGSRCAPADS